jgi:hypothetical protein
MIGRLREGILAAKTRRSPGEALGRVEYSVRPGLANGSNGACGRARTGKSERVSEACMEKVRNWVNVCVRVCESV